jgi:hypothetical protein
MFSVLFPTCFRTGHDYLWSGGALLPVARRVWADFVELA